MPKGQGYGGRLEECGMARILADLAVDMVTGVLTVSDETTHRRLFIQSGEVVNASSDMISERFGESLVRAGKITPENLEAALNAQKTSGKQLGGVLVELGYIKPKALFGGVMTLVGEIIAACATAGEGEWTFAPGDIPPEVIKLKVQVGDIVVGALRGVDDWTKISRDMPGMDSVLAAAQPLPKPYASVKLSGPEQNMLALFNGIRTLKEVFELSGEGDMDVLKTVFVLHVMGMALPKVGTLEQPAGASAPPGREIDEGEVMEVLEGARAKNLYEFLEVEDEASSDEIESACLGLLEKYDPDRDYPDGKEHLRAALEEIRSRVEEARTILLDDARRWEYDLSSAPAISGKGGGGKTKAAKDSEGARAAFSQGVEDFKRKDFVAASNNFQEAVRLDPTKAAYFSYLALALLQRPRREADAEEAMLEAVRLEPQNPDHQANLGLLYQRAGIKGKAREAFAAALKLDPENAKALAATGRVKK